MDSVSEAKQYAIKRFVALLFWALGLLLSGARLMLEAVTSPDDYEVLKQRLPNWVDWLFSTPWWVPSLLMALLTLAVIWFAWPRVTSRVVSREEAVSLGYLPKGESAASSYVETRLRLKRDPSGSGMFLQDGEKNILRWQQIFYSIEGVYGDGSKKITSRFDVIGLTLLVDSDYSRPIIESFGHKLPPFNLYPLGNKGALIQFNDDCTAPVIEIWFPPPNHYDNK